MTFSLHAGWGIEGAIGSKHKIDASYLSPSVGAFLIGFLQCDQFSNSSRESARIGFFVFACSRCVYSPELQQGEHGGARPGDHLCV